MLGDTITITHNAVSRVLSKINQDNYSSEYVLTTSTQNFRVFVRHTKEAAKTGALPIHRHYIELTVTTFATPTAFEVKDYSSFVVRNREGSDPAVTLLAAKSQLGWLTDANVTKLIAWES
jgi:hypothetical protein